MQAMFSRAVSSVGTVFDFMNKDAAVA